MQTIALQKWAVDNEPDLTREAYAQIECGGAEDCGCEACFNFATARHLVYSPEVLEFLDWLGIDPLLEAYARHDARIARGRHRYTVSFYLVGRIASGPATPVAERRGRERESLERASRRGGGLLRGCVGCARGIPRSPVRASRDARRGALDRERPRAHRTLTRSRVDASRARDRAAAAAPVPRERPRRVRAHHGRRRDDALPRARRAVRPRRGAGARSGTCLGHWQIRGYGLWAAEEKQSGALIGRIGLYRPEGWPGLEVGWLVARERWGEGFATEGARAALDYAFTVLGEPRAISAIAPENAASIRVAEKLGLRLCGDAPDRRARSVSIYEIRNASESSP